MMQVRSKTWAGIQANIGFTALGRALENLMDSEAEERDLARALEACLQSADKLGLTLVGVHLSHALDLLQTAQSLRKNPENNTI